MYRIRLIWIICQANWYWHHTVMLKDGDFLRLKTLFLFVNTSCYNLINEWKTVCNATCTFSICLLNFIAKICWYLFATMALNIYMSKNVSIENLKILWHLNEAVFCLKVSINYLFLIGFWFARSTCIMIFYLEYLLFWNTTLWTSVLLTTYQCLMVLLNQRYMLRRHTTGNNMKYTRH